jgi:murein DD-endopeptidase MepM/ murein hydrolase activator NlpD
MTKFIYTVLFFCLFTSTGVSKTVSNFIPNISPVKGFVSSEFGYRISPFSKKNSFHTGLDIVAHLGTPIYAPAKGIVAAVGRDKRLGKYVILSHANGIETRYGHVKGIFVREGQKVKKGSKIACVGMTGRTTGSHLHYEVLVNGKYIDPRKFILYDDQKRLSSN